MPYTPDATNYSEPTDIEKASTMGLEFRTLKAYIQSSVIAVLATKLGTSGTSTFSAAAQLRFPGGNALEGIIAGDYTSFTYDTNKILPNYGISWKALSTDGGAQSLFLGGYAGIYFITGGAVTASFNSLGVLAAAGFNSRGNITATGYVSAIVGGANGSIKLTPGDGAHTGYLQLYNPDGTRKAYVGYGGVGIGNPITFATDDSSNWQFSNNVIAPTFIGALTGNASTASSASAVAWTSVSGRPTALSQFTNDIGAGGSSGVASFNGRTGAVTPSSSDVTGALGFTPYNATNPSNYTSLAAVGAAGYITSSGNAATATSAGNGISTVSNVDQFIGSDSGNGFDLTNVTLSFSAGTLTCTRRKVYRSAADLGGGGP